MSNEKNVTIYKSIRVKTQTKNAVDQFLEKVNKGEDIGKITFDNLISFFLENVSKADIEKLQLKAITWEHEEKRLRRLYEKKKGQISEAKWRELIFLGQLQKFISDNSRLPVGAI